MKHNTPTAGYSIVEVLIAIAVLLIAIVGPLTIASKGLQNASFSKQQATAFFLAQEAVEMMIKKRNDNGLEFFEDNGNSWEWVREISDANCTNTNACGIFIDSDGATNIFECDDTVSCDLRFYDSGRTRYRVGTTGGIDSGFRRELFIQANVNRVRVRSQVSWDGANVFGGTEADNKVELEVYLYNIYENI